MTSAPTPAHDGRVQLRRAELVDAHDIAALHTDSWRRNYRGAYADAYLDGDILADRLAVWTARLTEPDPRARTVAAVDDAELVGFIHTVQDEDPTWGALVDNLHVTHGRQRRGIGGLLLATSIESAREQGTGLYLWVQEQNTRAQSFYEAQGGSRVGRAPIDPPGGIPERLSGTPMKLRYAWT